MSTMTRAELVVILRRVKYRDWEFRTLHQGNTGGWLMNVSFLDDTGTRQHGRKWYISQHMCLSEVVQTCLKAILTAVEHEVREQFTFDGQAVYSPHLDAEQLKAVGHQ